MASETGHDSSADVVVSFHEAIMYESDVQLLRPPAWFNDHCIVFAYEYLTHDVHAGDASSLFMHPGTVFMAHFMGGDDLAEAIGPLLGDLKQHLVFVPINNNSEAEASGGSHWSLLVFIRATNELWHYDSSPGSGNGAAARRIADNLGPLLAGNGERAPRFVEASAPVQSNGFDCGAYVVAISMVLASAPSLIVDAELREIVTPARVTEVRERLYQVAREKAKGTAAAKAGADEEGDDAAPSASGAGVGAGAS